MNKNDFLLKYHMHKIIPNSPLPYVKEASVLIALTPIHNDLLVSFTVRSTGLKQHAGEICFPGGSIEKQDKNNIKTATREAYEEIGLHPDNIEILGSLPYHYSLTEFKVSPIVAFIKNDFNPVFNEYEVSDYFTVPLSYIFKNLKPQKIQRGGKKHTIYCLTYKNYFIWGLTGSILHSLKKLITGKK